MAQKKPSSVKEATPLSKPQVSNCNPSKSALKTRVTIRYDVGFNNELYIRGSSAGLNWNKGKLLDNVESDKWVWETELPFELCEFKVLLNDDQYEIGINHLLSNGSNYEYSPHF
jgi:hypothetical protein